MILNCNNICKTFITDDILKNVSFHIEDGEKAAIVGINGAGKSTLLKIIVGELEADSGSVTLAKDASIGYLAQHQDISSDRTIYEEVMTVKEDIINLELTLRSLEKQMKHASGDELNALLETYTLRDHEFEQANGYAARSEVVGVLKGLGFSEEDFDKKISLLSGGEKTRVSLGRLLLSKPDILLLDEPTNYLDENHIEWLRRYLQEYENAFILISHDMEFLNSVVNIIYHMENQELNRYVGDYNKFLEVYEVKKAQLEAAYRRQQQEIGELKDFVARNKARVATRNMAMSRQKKLDKMDIIELAKEKPKPEFNFKEARAAGKVIFETDDLVLGYDKNAPLSKPINLRMERGEKIAIVGTNGIGKTTFLKSVLGLIKPVSGKAELGDYLYKGYFEQEIKPGDNTCIEEIWDEFPSMSQYEVRSALAKCGLTTEHIESKVRVLSGGEQAKVRLCKLINIETNVLLLDEPTNHLDIDAKDELKRALKAYKGAILLVCHEPDFYNDVVDKVWNLEEYSLLSV